MQFTLFLKAGLSAPDVLGACLQCQSVHLLSKIKSLEFQPQLVCLDNPPPEFSSVRFQRLPAVLHSDGSGTDVGVLNEIELKYPRGILNPDAKDLTDAQNATKQIYPQFCEYMQGGDISGLLEALQILDHYLRERESSFLLGNEMCLLDCSVLPQLHEIRVVIDRVKGTPIPDDLRKLWMYMFHGYQNKHFIKTCPYDMEICLAWTEKIRVPASDIRMPEWLPQEHHVCDYSTNGCQLSFACLQEWTKLQIHNTELFPDYVRTRHATKSEKWLWRLFDSNNVTSTSPPPAGSSVALVTR